MTDWTRKSIQQLQEAYGRGETSALEVVRQHGARIKESDLGAFITPLTAEAEHAARACDKSRAASEKPGLLAGIPVALKDNLATTFAPTTCGSRMLAGYVSPYDATVVTRLLAAGAICVGKTNMDEFGMGSSNENSAFGPVHNPHLRGMVAGGSSGGSAAAVTDRLCTAALGTDTGGSVRQPAALSGCVGFKPSYGAISRYGLVAFASSLDQIGPMARSVADVAAIFDVVAGPDPLDSTSTTQPVPSAVRAVAEKAGRLKLGVISQSSAAGVDPEVREAVYRLAEVCRRVGHEVVEVTLSHIGLGIATYYILANAEASANLARYDGVGFGPRAGAARNLEELYERTRSAGFGREVKRRIMLGTYVLSRGYYEAYYLRALQVRNLIRADFAAAFYRADVLLSPTSPVPAFALEEKISDPLAMYLCDAFTVPANLAGIPALSLPVGKTAAGLPLGIQLWGRHGLDHELLAAAAIIEELVGYDPH